MGIEPASSPNWAQVDTATDPPQLSGAWTLLGVHQLAARLDAVVWRPISTTTLQLDAGGIVALDTSGALFLLRLLGDLQQRYDTVNLINLTREQKALLDFVNVRSADLDAALQQAPVALNPLAIIGQQTLGKVKQILAFLAFTGEVSLALARTLIAPRQLRGRALLATVDAAGVRAIPIVGLMAFLLGVVIAYQGGLQLRSYGANIFVVELVSLTMLRELAPLIAAIMVAGRTGSAFTAQIGTMRVTEEVDALRTIGIDPIEILVLPKLLALVLALPLLTVLADAASIFGGMVLAQVMLDVSFADFLQRIPQAVSATSFLVGVSKAPVFAVIIALAGCYQGFQVSNSAESVGRQTTISVVQAIFLVICADAVFSIVFGLLGI